LWVPGVCSGPALSVKSLLDLPAMIAVVLICCGFLGSALGSGSGRAFPIDSENYVTREFQNINSDLEWDSTNFLVDLAGHYANCNSLGTSGVIRTDRQTPSGASIIGIVDSVRGTQSDVDAVNRYIRDVIDSWTRSGAYNSEIRSSDRFGCSVRPGCSGQVAVACLFSNGRSSNIIDPNDRPIGEPRALAFTTAQYNLAEKMTGNRWDRSHYLENLSGHETDCSMIGTRDWPFTTALSEASRAGKRVIGNYGYSVNSGSTSDAIVNVLQNFKDIRYAKSVGCSVIPDCMFSSGRGGREEMYVVVSCLYEEN